VRLALDTEFVNGAVAACLIAVLCATAAVMLFIRDATIWYGMLLILCDVALETVA
jgi:hypothetical protein